MAGQWLKKQFETLYHKGKVLAGNCSSPTLEDMQKLLENAEGLTKRAKTVSDFSNAVGVLGEAGDKMGEVVNKINELGEKAKTMVGDVRAACEISEAISVLNDWSTSNGKISNQEAAKQFDRLFGGLANYMNKLPPPFSTFWGKFFESIKDYNFFSNMQKKMDFTTYGPEGEQLQQLERQGY
jgi:hypothetical protein